MRALHIAQGILTFFSKLFETQIWGGGIIWSSHRNFKVSKSHDEHQTTKYHKIFMIL